MSRRYPILAVFVLLTLSAGCVKVIEPPQGMDVQFSGSFNRTETGFSMDGHLLPGIGAPKRDVYHDVAICLYTENGDTMYTERIGDWHVDARMVSIQTNKVPEYIVIDSPEFWDGNNRIEYYNRIHDETVLETSGANESVVYDSTIVTSRKELPVGGCAVEDPSAASFGN